jgi:Phosphorylase superfamily
MPSPAVRYFEKAMASLSAGTRIDPTAAAPSVAGMPVVDWSHVSQAGLAPRTLDAPRNFRPNSPLPAADVVAITWTSAEWSALSFVFTGALPAGNGLADWLGYGRGFVSVYPALFQQSLWQSSALSQDLPPSLAPLSGTPAGADRWGFFRLVQVGNLRVLLFKSQLHISTDGVTLPLLEMTRRILDDTGASLLLSVGTSGAVQPDDRIGDVAITNAAHLLLTSNLETATYNDATFQSAFAPNFRLVPDAEALMLSISGPTMPAPAIGYPLDQSIAYADGSRRPRVRNYIEPLKPVLTTNGFSIATTDPDSQKNYDGYCCLEMDDALLAMTACDAGRNYVSVRNFSDPVMNGNLPVALQSAISSYIYTVCGERTSYNGALAAWALIAGMQ